MSKRVLITGGCGFQGSNLADRLIERGYDVRMLDTFSDVSMENIKKFNLGSGEIIWGSITDKNLIDKTVRDVDLVFHLAANVHVDDSISEPVKYYEVNVLGTNNILEMVRKRNIPMIHISTCEVYGHQDGVLTEESPFRANSPYASSKAGADIMCYSYWKTYGVDVTVLRPANVFGPGQRFSNRGAVIPIWVNNVLNGKDINIYGDGTQSREFIYIDDLIDVYEKFIEHKLNSIIYDGEIFNVGSNQQISMNELANIILMCSPYASVKINHVEGRSGEVKKFVLDSSKVMNYFNWCQKVGIKQGIEKYINWAKEI